MNLNRLFNGFAIISSMFLLSSCYYDNAEELYPQKVDCDTSSVSYSTVIVPFLEQACNSCHNTQTPLGGINLEDFNQVKQTGNNGSLVGSMKQNPNYSIMPPSGEKMPDCNILQVETWINDGMPNN